jgi:WD40 repeat protein
MSEERPLYDLSGIRTRHDFARELTLLRERAGRTVRDVAKITGVPPATIGGYFGGRHLPPVKPATMLRDILAACGVTDPAVVEQWQRTLLRVRRAPGRRPATAPVPYRGLETFQPEHAEWFYGRENLTQLLVELLLDKYKTGGFLVVVGPSGSGKSSLLRAGMIPAVRSGGLGMTGAHTWPLLLLVPGQHPLAELADQLAAMTGRDREKVRKDLLEHPSGTLDQARRALTDAGAGAGVDPREVADAARVVVVVDQFEEVFTACTDDDERQAFIAALHAAAGGEPSAAQPSTESAAACGAAALVVLGLRADFYGHALRHPLLVPALQSTQVVVGPMTEEQLRLAIVEPARRANIDIEEGLVELLLRDLSPALDSAPQGAHDAGALPLLSHALRATWERGHRRTLTVADYQEAGGIHGAVARSAEDVFCNLTPAQQRLARQIFLRLVHVADDSSDTRRRVARTELPLDDSDGEWVLERFIEQRLITAGSDRVEITHEALLVAWPRLREWLDTDRAGLRTHRQLTVAAEAWRDSGRDPQALYRGGRLSAAREWHAVASRRADLNALEREFLEASIEHDVAELLAVRRRARRLQQLLAALTALALVAGFFAVYAFQQRRVADHERDLAISRQLAITANQLRTTNVALAAQLSLAAYRVAPTVEARSSLLDSYATPTASRVLGPAGVIQSVAVTQDGRTMAAGGADFGVRVWGVADPGHPRPAGSPLRGHTATIYSAAFSPDGHTLATGSGDKTVRLWSVGGTDGPTALATLTGPGSTVYAVAFSPDGHTLAAASADRTVRLWNVVDPATPVVTGPPLTGPEGYVQSVAFSPDGHFLAAGSADKTVRLWNVENPQRAVALGGPLRGPGKTVFSVAFSPDGRTLAAGSADKAVHLWDVSRPDHPVAAGPPLTGASGWVNSVGFSPDGRTLAAASSDEKVWLWDVPSRRVSAMLPHPAPVTSAVFTRDPHSLTTSAGDGVLRRWDVPGPIITGPVDSVFNTAFDAHTHTMALASNDNTVSLWNVTDPRHPTPLGPTLTNAGRLARASGAATLSPDRHTLAVGNVDGSVQLWDVADPARPVPLPTRLTGHTATIEALSFSPDGHILAIASDDHTASLWDVTDPGRPARIGSPLTEPTNYVYSPAFSPDARTLAVGTADNVVHLWDITDPARPRPRGRPLTGPASYVFTVAFSPDGRTLAVGSADNTVRLWDVTNADHPVALGPPLTGPDNYVWAVAFSPDGRTLAAGAGDGTIWLWDVTDRRHPEIRATLKGHTGSVYIIAFDTDRSVLASGGADKQARLWDTDPDRVAAYICATAGDPITRDEWAKYVPGLPYHPPC